MPSKQSRLDRFLSRQLEIPLKQIKPLLAQGRIKVDSRVCKQAELPVNQFSVIVLDEQILQQNAAIYLMLNKPVGVVCATKDKTHRTVLDLIDPELHCDLHIAGRLDLNSSGLVLLTNDGRWSRSLSKPESSVKKVYRVKVEKPITPDYKSAFAEGMYFPFENLTTKPVMFEQLGEHEALLTLTEGRYHQIKRMFGRFRNKVLSIHRQSIGNLVLDPTLQKGESRGLTHNEIMSIVQA